jgi:hypothetical protein
MNTDHGAGLDAGTGPPSVVSREEAPRLLDRSGVLWLVMCGHLDDEVMPNGLKGVTWESMQREIAWQESASPSQRVRRSLGNPVLWF